ncbi:GTP cyclohydrolase I [Ferroplasma acidiphilum]|jgi:GTP cyclohydrolase I|uniref:GTP cyclohydrolase I n=1 Tax=Ferroplasma acidiphilum TaxID=74969 RepID=A0A1V0N396_9ARCH|nr:GTP cyclohydrolase I FolE [Ferroplasma acidiphilum]ARD84630.1 GTP cyclohydrolase I [Ferroplasma acidiphilum]MCL4348841.1 GTP cyclohydrolase I [Candidatus Thermoplasmatota archaeon]NOL59442.1 GTP cyclohydrolase I FolE [Ferroplasma acidiphilum]WMT53582.1 MAG: GTP cyclohydrolase I FolE [Ferroplasma acidiphilum]
MEENSRDILKESIKALVYNLHEEYGWFNDEELKNTPRRIENFYREWYGARNFTFTKFKITGHESMVIVKNISFYSMCSHHLLPFFGNINIAYLPRPGGYIAGVSKLVRSVNKIASKPQLQENMTSEIVNLLYDNLNPLFVMVTANGQHMCMMMRGVKQESATMVTSSVKYSDVVKTELESLKNEALKMMGE